MPIFRSFLILLLVLFSFICLAQEIKYEVESQAIATSNDVVPFWMRSNQYGSIPSEGISGSFLGRAYKEYDTARADNWYGKKELIDWGAGFEGRANLGKNSDLLIIEGYGKVRLAMFEFKAGRTKDVMGLNGDTALSSGNFAVSGNALDIPKVEISIPEYWIIPGLDGLIAIKGNFAHGWVGKVTTNTKKNVPTYLHQTSLYGRIGKDNWKINLYGGFSHQAFWGNEDEVFSENFDLTTLETLFYVATGKVYKGSEIGLYSSKIGNHIGSIDVGLSYEFKNFKLMVYRQNFYDVGALARLANIRDGLNGITLTNKKSITPNSFYFKKVLLEFLYTKHQAGEVDAKFTKSGDEDYYNNFFYNEGWSYKHLGLGTPFISENSTVRSEHPRFPTDYFVNNRVVGLHLGLISNYKNWEYVVKGSFTQNYGTFGTSYEGHSGGTIEPKEPIYGIFGRVNQFSAYLEANKLLDNGLRIGGAIAVDKGDLLYNSVGGLLKVSKSF